MPGRGVKVEAVVLRSFRFAEADRILHLLTREHGRVGAICKGIRRTRSRFGGRLEPLSRVELVLHEGRGELATVTAAATVSTGERVRADPYRLAVATVGVETVTKLFPEQHRNERLYDGLVRFLEVVAEVPTPTPAVPAQDPLALAFGLKLLTLAGWAPRLDACASCGAQAPPARYDAAAGGVVCGDCAGGFAVAPGTVETMAALLRAPLGVGGAASGAAGRQIHRALAESYAQHGGVQLRSYR